MRGRGADARAADQRDRGRKGRLASLVLTAFRAVACVAPWLPHPGSAATVSPLEIRPHEKILEVALVEWDQEPGRELAIASARSTGPQSAERFVTIYGVRADATAAAGVAVETLAQHQVPDDVVAFGVGDPLGAGTRAVLYFTAQSVFEIRADSKPRAVLRGQRLFFSMPASDALPFWDGIVDLDGDQRDDLLLADARGYIVYRGSAMGASSDAAVSSGRVEVGADYAKEPLRRRRRTARDEGPLVMWRSLRRVVWADLNGDKRLDLLAMKRAELLGYLQREDGSFPLKPDVQHRLVSERGLAAGPVNAGPPPAIVHGDVDGDSRMDYVVPELDLEELSTRLRIFLSGEQGLPESPSQIIKLSSLGTSPELVELNGDGHLDVGISVFRSDRLLSVSANQIETLDFTYYGFLFDPGERSFSRRPDLRFDASWTVPEDETSADERESDEEPGFIRCPGDFSGDGICDTVLFTAEGAFSVFPLEVTGSDRRTLSTASEASIEATLPPSSRVRFADLSGDGRTDSIFVYEDHVRVVVSP